jgi:hypothetical protein
MNLNLSLGMNEGNRLNEYRNQERNALLALLAAGILLLACVLACAAEPKGDGRQMLSKHETVAVFEGLTQHTCRGLTSLCPDRCGHSGSLASFRIVHYIAYEKPGQYGDPKQERYQFLVEDNLKSLKVTKALKETLDGLKKDDYVRLDWQHDYVTKNRSSFPERTVTQLKKITREEAEKLKGPAAK